MTRHNPCLFETLEDRRLLSVSIDSVDAAPNPVFRTQKVVVTAHGVTATDGDKVKSVIFFVDTDASGIPTAGDIIVGTAFKQSGVPGDWTATKIFPRRFLLGPYTIDAVARGSTKFDLSTAVKTTLTVSNNLPVIKKLVAPTSVKLNKVFRVSAIGVTDKETRIAGVSFTIEINSVATALTTVSRWSAKVDSGALGLLINTTYTISATATDLDGGASIVATTSFTMTS